MTVKMNVHIQASKTTYSKFSNLIKNIHKAAGLKIKAEDGHTVITTPHCGFIASKVISKMCR
jgi:hypothetical protein